MGSERKPKKNGNERQRDGDVIPAATKKRPHLQVSSSGEHSLSSKEHKSVLSSIQDKPENVRKAKNGSVDAGSDEDDELLAAAAVWANEENTTQTTPSGASPTKQNSLDVTDPSDAATPTTTPPAAQQNLSLHITQLPYDAIELDIRRLLAEKGCSITSIRLVYDRDERGRKTVFRGVAFVDVLDQTSFDKAVALHHKSSIRGRKLNIRPTRSKQELADIVTKTKELVQEKIRKQLSCETEGQAESSPGKSADAASKKKRQKQKAKQKRDRAKAKAAKGPKKVTKHQAQESKSKEKSEPKEKHKLTKKERNRRAAIIRGRKGR